MLVRAKKDMFIDSSFRAKGEEFDYSGPKNTNVEPVEEAGEPAEVQSGKRARRNENAE